MSNGQQFIAGVSNMLEEHFHIKSKSVEVLPLGNDPGASVYKIVDFFQQTYFLKRSKGEGSKVGVRIPYYLYSQGIDTVISPIVSKKGDLWVTEKGCTWVLYPFVENRSGYEVGFSPLQWSSFGESLRNIHAVSLPEELYSSLPKENFHSTSCGLVKEWDGNIQNTAFNDPVSAKFADFWMEKRRDILRLINNTEQLERQARTETNDLVLCHADLHPGNTVIDQNGKLFIVDWDSPILAPRERDLMFIGGGHRFKHTDIHAFYMGYGEVKLNRRLIAYYRNERILADIAVYADEILGEKGAAEERETGLELLMRQFEPGREVEAAFSSLS
ncbi:phosphotransferase [Lysinibacillus sphaericus]